MFRTVLFAVAFLTALLYSLISLPPAWAVDPPSPEPAYPAGTLPPATVHLPVVQNACLFRREALSFTLAASDLPPTYTLFTTLSSTVESGGVVYQHAIRNFRHPEFVDEIVGVESYVIPSLPVAQQEYASTVEFYDARLSEGQKHLTDTAVIGDESVIYQVITPSTQDGHPGLSMILRSRNVVANLYTHEQFDVAALKAYGHKLLQRGASCAN